MARLAIALKVDLGELVGGLQKKRGRSCADHLSLAVEMADAD